MGYYQGDYYQGDYYQGGLFSRLASNLKKALPFAASFIPGGGVLGKVGGIVGRTAPKIARGAGGIGGIAIATRLAMGPKGDNGDDDGRRHRRMNVTNVKALRRAIRRARGFAKIARKVLTYPIQKPPKGRALFKKRGR